MKCSISDLLVLNTKHLTVLKCLFIYTHHKIHSKIYFYKKKSFLNHKIPSLEHLFLNVQSKYTIKIAKSVCLNGLCTQQKPPFTVHKDECK